MNPFHLVGRDRRRAVQEEPGLPARHSAHKSRVDPDASPPSVIRVSPVRPWRSRRVAPYLRPAREERGPAVRDLRALWMLAALTAKRDRTPLQAAQTLYAPELLEESHARNLA